MSGLRVLLVYNPTAGDGLDVDRIVSLAEDAGHTVDPRSVKEEDWARALKAEPDLVVVAGGDGTVRKVFKTTAGTECTTTLLPVGSANNIARSLGIADQDLGRQIEGWADGRRATFDLGTLSFGSQQETFVESAGGGPFAAQLERAEDVERQGEDKVEFGLGNIAAVVERAPAHAWGVLADGHDLSGDFLGVEVMNVRETGPNIPLAPAAETADAALDLVLIGHAHRASFMAYVDSRLAGRTVEPPNFDAHRARRVELEPPVDSPFHVDDELEPRPAGNTVTAEVGPAVRLLLPSA